MNPRFTAREQEVLRDLLEVSADVIRFRLPFAFPDDSVPLDGAVALLQRAREALRAAALSTIEARPVYPSRAPAKVENMLETVCLGQTERGSFVVPVISPLGTIEAGADELVPRTDEPYARHVTVQFARALSAVQEAIAEARAKDELTPLSSAVAQGVSANLCTAVGAMTSVVGRYRNQSAVAPELSIWFSWSPARPVKQGTPGDFAIPQQDAGILKDAATFLKSLTPRPRVTITGQVIRLEREESRPDGAIGIKGDIDGTERTIVVRLSAEDYARALHAHELRVPVTCSGVLEQRGTHSVLEEPVDFTAPEPFLDF